MKDKINPPHYKDKKIETIEAIRSQMTDAEFVGYLKGNIMKYISRMGIKVATIEGARDDVGKAHWYCEYLLKTLTEILHKNNKKKTKADEDLSPEELEELLSPKPLTKGTIIKWKNRKEKDNEPNK